MQSKSNITQIKVKQKYWKHKNMLFRPVQFPAAVTHSRVGKNLNNYNTKPAYRFNS